MTVAEEGLYLVERVRALCERPPPGVEPWCGPALLRIIQSALPYARDHQRFYLTFLDGLRDLLTEDEDPVLQRFMTQAVKSEPRVLADSDTTRDHLTHVTQVYLLGWVLLHSTSFFANQSESWQPYGWRVERWSRLNRAWLFTSLLHDCAYSVEFAAKTHIHETRLRAMFGSIYKPGSPGQISLEDFRKSGSKLWRHRGMNIGLTFSAEHEQLVEGLYSSPDHAAVTAQALFLEAQHQSSKELRDILQVAATSLACHNFRFRIDPKDSPSETARSWFRDLSPPTNARENNRLH